MPSRGPDFLLAVLCSGHLSLLPQESGGIDEQTSGVKRPGGGISPYKGHRQPWGLLCLPDCLRHG